MSFVCRAAEPVDISASSSDGRSSASTQPVTASVAAAARSHPQSTQQVSYKAFLSVTYTTIYVVPTSSIHP